MDSEEDIANQYLDLEDNTIRNKEKCIAISNHDDAIKLHIDILALKD